MSRRRVFPSRVSADSEHEHVGCNEETQTQTLTLTCARACTRGSLSNASVSVAVGVDAVPDADVRSCDSGFLGAMLADRTPASECLHRGSVP